MNQCKLTYQVERDAVSLLVLEMHKKRRIIQSALQDTNVRIRQSGIVPSMDADTALSYRWRRSRASGLFAA